MGMEMKAPVIRGLVPLIAVLVVSCASSGTDGSAGGSSPDESRRPVETTTATTSSTVAASVTTVPVEPTDWVGYVGDAVDLVEKVYYDPNSVDWAAVRDKALATVSEDPSQLSAHRALSQLFYPRGVLDAHSRFERPGQPSSSPIDQVPPTGERLNEGVGYLSVPSVTVDGKHLADYAATLHELGKGIDDPPVCGWVIDVRANQGGNVYPMWLGVGPLIGEGDFFAFAKVGQEPAEWISYVDGEILIGDQPLNADEEEADELAARRIIPQPFQPADTQAPVAVLTSGFTASAGEMVAIAFKGRPGTRSFGEATAGYTTGVEGFALDDGAILWISVGVSVDRTGERYAGSLQPDEVMLQIPGDDDPTLKRAVAWIGEENSAC